MAGAICFSLGAFSMSRVRIPRNVKPIAAITYVAAFDPQGVEAELGKHLGHLDHKSETYPVIHTRYYETEMGAELYKYFVSFFELVSPEIFTDLKLLCNEVELANESEGRRQVNIDPGYLELSKVVLMTTKNFYHRVYVGKGIYGDVHLRYHNQRFEPLPWTYPDYREQRAIDFFTRVRKIYHDQVMWEGFGAREATRSRETADAD
jgi:hypothetical protein